MIEVLFPKTRRSVLALLFTRPEEAFYLREVVRATGAGRGAVERELGSLAKAGIVVRETRGNLTYYRANRECPIYTELQGMMVKTAGLADVVRAALAGVKGIQLAFIFGSTAAGTADVRSDVDVLVVADAPFSKISAALHDAQDRLGREITPTVYSPTEFKEKLADKHHFLMRVLSEPKIVLVGDLDGLEQVGRSVS
jgi:predicted nucleotidyltransferase